MEEILLAALWLLEVTGEDIRMLEGMGREKQQER